MDKLEEEIDDSEKQTHQNRIAKLKNCKEKLIKAREVIETRKQQIKQENRETHQVNIEEPEACMMDSYSGYNIQIGVDTKTQLIVSTDVVEDRNDARQFSRQHQKIEENFKEVTSTSSVDRVYIADGGYSSYEQIGYVIDNGINAYIPVKKQPRQAEEITKEDGRVRISDFRYFEKGDYYVCPNDKKLHVKSRGGDKYLQGKIYQTAQCGDCSLRSKCLGKFNKTNIRTIRRDERQIYYEKMHEKMNTDQGKIMMKKRRISVEPVFGNLKSNMGYRRFRLKGIINVQNEFILMCIGHNLNKMFRLLFFHLLSNIKWFIKNIRLMPAIVP
jgi:transposase